MDAFALQSVLVTGASGFIGGRLVRRLIQENCRVSCLVRGSSRADHLRSAGACLFSGDVTDRLSVKRALDESQAGIVFHLAGLVRALRSDDFGRVNAGGVETVVSACAECADPPVLVVVSSLSAAGPCHVGYLSGEAEPASPVSNYGRSKLAGEEATAKYSGAVPVSVVRPSIVYGPGDRAVLEMFRAIARWGIHVVPGQAEQRLSLVHVDDLVEGLLRVGAKGERIGGGLPGKGIYFIAGEETPNHVELGQVIARALGRKAPHIVGVPGSLLKLFGAGGDVIGRLTGRPRWICKDKMIEALAGSWTCSAAKIHAQLDWSPASPLTAHMRETAKWYRQAGWL